MSNRTYTIAIAGSTARTVLCAEALRKDSRFQLVWALTAAPKPVGRKQELVNNPVHVYTQTHHLPVFLINKKIDSLIQQEIESSIRPDILLVVDFGYLVPHWLLAFPSMAPLNIHPSLLPDWRGSSPGQFVLLYGQSYSAVTLMIMNASLDQGPVLKQLHFDVNPTWTQTQYYDHAFSLMEQALPDLVFQFCNQELAAVPQPDSSPTPTARRLTRDDGFVAWETVQQAMHTQAQTEARTSGDAALSPLLQDALSAHPSLAHLLASACRAFSPWPGLWTLVHTNAGQQRLKLLQCHASANQLCLDMVQLEGKQPSTWNELRTAIKEV